ncbi:ATP/GTP-binding protein [Streptomyces sp. NPDC056053]|uniref:ATP/GTP-binding protein n=1 Tax=Streptomyces sp. NPDC056053 TaxID=3345696 RepID=UPI0035E08428
MSDVDDPNGILVRGPWNGDPSYVPPPIPDYADTIPAPDDIPAVPPESPEETTMQLPPVPAAPAPETALRSEGITPPQLREDESEYEEGEYIQPRSLADRLGDWLEFLIEKARADREAEAPFREAEVARKAALLEGRTAQEIAMMEQNGKLHAAMMKARGDKAAARGKSDADRAKSPGSGLGTDKGRPKTGGGSSRGGSGSGPNGTGPRGPNSNSGSGRSGSGQSGGGSGKGGTKGPERSSGGRSPGSGRDGASKGAKGPQAGSGSSGRSGGGGAKDDGGRGRKDPATSARTERARGRQDRAGARQTGRQERRSAGHAADIADRTKDRDQARANRQKEWEDRRTKKAERDAERKAKKAERAAARKAKREAADAKTGKDAKTGEAGEDAKTSGDTRAAKTGKDTKNPKAGEDAKTGGEKVDLSKDKDTGKKSEKTAEDDPGNTSDTKKSNGAKAKKRRRVRRRRRTGAGKTGRARRRGRNRRTRPTGSTGTRGRAGRPSDNSPFGADDPTPTMEWPQHPTRPPRPADSGEDDIEDAVIVPDEPGAVTTGAKGLPPAPEKHTARPGTTRPTAQEDPVASEVSRPTPGQAGMAAKHRTDITFGEYLTEIVNIALAAARDKEHAQDLAVALGKVADALRDMAADLVGDHNIATEVVDQITDLADAATRMKQLAERCATECEIASEAARIAATSVGRVYGQDIQAMDDAGLAHASAAAHHD